MPEDREILDAFRQEGKEDYAFNLLVRKYSRDLYWKIRRMVFDHDDADDILQNTFLKAWKYLPDFREESRLFTWLYRIAVNETLNFLKSKRLRTMFSLTGNEKTLADKFVLYRRRDNAQTLCSHRKTSPEAEDSIHNEILRPDEVR